MPRIQEWIHTLEEGRGATVIRFLVVLFGFIALALVFDFRCFKNFATQEAMDAAQLGRNIADGKGYTTGFVRPFSIYLFRDHREDRNPMLKTDHPDIANAPVYPCVLATLFKAAPVKFEIPRTAFYTYQPERWIAGLNQVLFFAAVLMVFFIGSRFFDRNVGWVASIIFAASELYWRFSVSGLSTMLLIVIVLGIIWCLALIDEWQAEELPPSTKIIEFSIIVGALTAAAALTRYSLLWLIVPVLLYVSLFTARFRGKVAVVISITFIVLVVPWIVRNFEVSGTPFGTAGYAIFEQTPPFPGDSLQRSLDPEAAFSRLIPMNDLARKLLLGLREIVTTDLPKLGGNWVTAFFLAGLLIPFRKPTLSRVRIFIVAALAIFALVQAWGHTQLSDVSPQVNSENLLAIFAPAIFIYGTAFFFTVVEQLHLQAVALRSLVSGLFVLVVSAPLILAILPPRSFAFAYPPYFPPLIQKIAFWMKPDELIMSDMPWAVSWYGHRQSVDLTLDYDKQFFAINDDMKPVAALYLTPITINTKFLMDILRPTIRGEKTWQRFLFESLSRGEVMAGFPLKKSRLDFLPDHFFLTDWERWKKQARPEEQFEQKLPDAETGAPSPSTPSDSSTNRSK